MTRDPIQVILKTKSKQKVYNVDHVDQENLSLMINHVKHNRFQNIISNLI